MDRGDRMMLWESADDGRTWRHHNDHGNFGHYGEMYPRFLPLKDGRLLLTFTLRSNSTEGGGLGLRAILSSDGGQTWDVVVNVRTGQNNDISFNRQPQAYAFAPQACACG